MLHLPLPPSFQEVVCLQPQAGRKPTKKRGGGGGPIVSTPVCKHVVPQPKRPVSPIGFPKKGRGRA